MYFIDPLAQVHPDLDQADPRVKVALSGTTLANSRSQDNQVAVLNNYTNGLQRPTMSISIRRLLEPPMMDSPKWT